MAPRSPPLIQSSTGFLNPTDLSAEETIALSVTSSLDLPERLLRNLSWNGGAIGYLSLILSQDNRSVSSGTFHLAGSLFDTKSFNAGVFWDVSRPTTLSLAINDLSKFRFPGGNLVSSYVSSSEFPHAFSQDDATIDPDAYDEAGVSNFCLRAFAYPTSEAWAKIIILMFPCPEASLADNPKYTDVRFPGVKLADFVFPLGPSSLTSPLKRQWGFPLAPGIFPGMPISVATGVPSGRSLRLALTEMLRTAILPEVKANYATFHARCQDIINRGEAGLLSKLPPIMWPPLPATDPDNSILIGWFNVFLSLFYYRHHSYVFKHLGYAFSASQLCFISIMVMLCSFISIIVMRFFQHHSYALLSTS